MTPGIAPVVVVPVARLVSLRFDAVGQVRALSLLGCPTVPPRSTSRPCERSGRALRAYARTRVL
ncbi:hypothetical protein EMIT0P171_190106 [Pseudomonas sp. IT-P171]